MWHTIAFRATAKTRLQGITEQSEYCIAHANHQMRPSTRTTSGMLLDLTSPHTLSSSQAALDHCRVPGEVTPGASLVDAEPGPALAVAPLRHDHQRTGCNFQGVGPVPPRHTGTAILRDGKAPLGAHPTLPLDLGRSKIRKSRASFPISQPVTLAAALLSARHESTWRLWDKAYQTLLLNAAAFCSATMGGGAAERALGRVTLEVAREVALLLEERDVVFSL